MPKIYNYKRVSTKDQNFNIQVDDECLTRLSLEHKLPISNLEFKDFGVSSYRGANLKRSLGDFLNSDIAEGSILACYSLDRLSRQSFTDARSLYQQFMNKKVWIYSQAESYLYKDDLMSGILSDICFARANNESEAKSKRASDNIRNHIRKHKEGDHTSIIPTHNPIWITSIKNLTLQPYYTEAIKSAIKLFLSGKGNRIVNRHLNENYPKLKGSILWNETFVSTLRRNKALYGVKVVCIDNKEVEIPNYYPPLITQEEFLILQNTIKHVRQGCTDTIYMLSGIRVLRCNKCKGTLTGVLKRGRIKYKCQNGMKGISECGAIHYDGELLERLVLILSSDLPLPSKEDKTPIILSEIKVIEDKIKDATSRYLANPNSNVWGKTIDTLEGSLTNTKALLLTQSVNSKGSGLDRLASLYQEDKGLLWNNLGTETRGVVKQVIKNNIRDIEVGRVWLFRKSNEQRDQKRLCITLKVVFLSGVSRVFYVHPFNRDKDDGEVFIPMGLDIDDHGLEPSTHFNTRGLLMNITLELRKHNLNKYLYPNKKLFNI